MDKINSPFQELWLKVMNILERELSSATIDRWFKNIEPGEIRDEKLVVYVPDDFFKSWIEDNYSNLIGNALKQCGSPITEFVLEVKKITYPPSTTSFEDPRVNASYESVSVIQGGSSNKNRSEYPPNLNPQYTLGEFVVGPSNRFAHAACIAVAEQPAKAYNPLFIYGPVGLGKTHLMQAIGHEVFRKNPGTKVLYITSEKFTNQLISSIQNQTTQQFRERYRNVDVLLIDDIHFIAGKEATQEEFFHTFNALYDNHKQIIVSSDRTPKDIINMEERLISRFEWGLVTDIQRPDFETRSAILRKKAERHRIPVPDEVTNFIAEVVVSNIRELEGSLMRVVAYAELTNQAIGPSLAKEVLKKSIQESERAITPDLIKGKVVHYFSLKITDMTSSKRSKNIVYPRQIAMYLCRELTDLSLPEIGGIFGGKDHTTILYACDKIKTALERDSSLRETISRIKQEIGV